MEPGPGQRFAPWVRPSSRSGRSSAVGLRRASENPLSSIRRQEAKVAEPADNSISVLLSRCPKCLDGRQEVAKLRIEDQVRELRVMVNLVVLHTPSMDLSDDGQRLDSKWIEVGNNVCGTVRGCRDASALAEYFVRAGWTSRSSSWCGYELDTNWCQVEIDPIEGSSILLNGVVDPLRLDELAGLLGHFGVPYSLELYDEDDALVRETHG